jgi:hypothetical protein
VPEVVTVSVGTLAFSCSAKLFVTLPATAVSVTFCALATDDTVAVNPALVELAGTVTVAGRVTAVLLLERLTTSPPLGAAAFNVILQASVPDPVIDALLQERPLRVAMLPVPVPLSVPVPLRPITTVGLLDELLAMVS